ncbi:GTP-binding protein [Microbacterium sp. NPDC096154]|uniref:CobW family GTP-binding protein n=1 Tax=Microbacterium sp. NPDC096154 TaxID=3155549 RepID=UPI00331F0AB5
MAIRQMRQAALEGRRFMRAERIPVIGVTGYLGAGKTTLLNHLLARPGARLGVVVNDFGEINVDAALVTGQIDEAASIAGGCICCLPDAGGLDDALARLTDPRLGLDAVLVEASGAADPLALARLIRFSGVERVRPGGLIDVVDAREHERAVDTGAVAPARFAAATLVVVNKLDCVPAARARRDRTATGPGAGARAPAGGPAPRGLECRRRAGGGAAPREAPSAERVGRARGLAYGGCN